MPKKSKLTFAAILVLVIALVSGGYVFNYFCGCIFSDPVDIAVDSVDRLNQPPIILYPIGDPPVNVTYVVSTGTLGDGEPLSVYQYWYFWPGCALAPASPLCLAGHTANDWEPLYIYWKTTNPTAPTLLAIYTRFHFFFWRQTSGSQATLNGTQPIITFSTTYHVPTVDTYRLSQFIKPTNASLSIPFNPSAAPPFIAGAWYYAVTNGGPHTLTVFLDPGSPPASGPTAFENDANGNAGPVDPFTLYGTGRNFQIGLIAGGGTILGIFGLLSAVRIDIAGFRKALGRR